MLALVLMVGIVTMTRRVLENIFRFVEEKKMGAFEAAHAATAEISLAVMATTFSLVVIFVPVSFMSSIAGRFLFQFGLTAAVAVLVSLLVSFTLTPMMSARMFSFREPTGAGAHLLAKSRRGFYAWIDRWYSRALAFAMRHRLAVAGLAVLVMLSSIPLYSMVRQEYTPGNTDEGEFEISVSAREGTSLPAMDGALRMLEEELRKIPAIRTVLASVGGGGFLGSVNHARIFVALAPHRERVFSWGRLLSLNPLRAFQGNFSQRDVIQEVRRHMKKFPELRISVRSSQSSINLGGPTMTSISRSSDRGIGVARRMRKRCGRKLRTLECSIPTPP